MTKTEYLRECLLRSTTFQGQMLRFYQKYPPVFVTGRVVPRPGLPKWLSPIVVKRRTRALVAKPAMSSDPRLLFGLAIETVLLRCGLRRLSPDDGQPYFNALGRVSLERYEKDWRGLQRKWPHVSPQTLQQPSVAPLVRPPLVIGHLPGMPAGVCG